MLACKFQMVVQERCNPESCSSFSHANAVEDKMRHTDHV